MVSAWMLERYFEKHQKHNNSFSSNIHKNVVPVEKITSYLKWEMKLETTTHTNQSHFHHREKLLPFSVTGPVVYFVGSHLRAIPWSSNGFYQYFHRTSTQSTWTLQILPENTYQNSHQLFTIKYLLNAFFRNF